jgi:hypothetical protein
MKPIPGNIKEVLGQLTGPQQVAVRGYIVTPERSKTWRPRCWWKMRNRIHALPRHELCTNDHGHDGDTHMNTPRRSKKLKDMQGTIMDTGTRKGGEHKHDSNCP